MTRLETPRWLKNFSLALIFFMLCTEVGFVLITIRISRSFIPLPPDLRFKWSVIIWTLLLVVPTLFTILVSYLAYVTVYSAIEFDQTTVRLQRPFRKWAGPWSSIRKAYIFDRKGLNLHTTDSFWRMWPIRLNPRSLELIEEVKDRLGPGVWLNEKQARWYVLRHIAPVILLFGTLLLLAGEYMRREVFPELNHQTAEYFKTHPMKHKDK